MNDNQIRDFGWEQYTLGFKTGAAVAGGLIAITAMIMAWIKGMY